LGAAFLFPVGQPFLPKLAGGEDEQVQGRVDLLGREVRPGDGGLSQLSLGGLGDVVRAAGLGDRGSQHGFEAVNAGAQCLLQGRVSGPQRSGQREVFEPGEVLRL
jgi:hypothetical protein